MKARKLKLMMAKMKATEKATELQLLMASWLCCWFLLLVRKL